jgi:hypothetical protein
LAITGSGTRSRVGRMSAREVPNRAASVTMLIAAAPPRA